jgi:hypothetical protein
LLVTAEHIPSAVQALSLMVKLAQGQLHVF